jgi:hypothetical protein
MSDTPLEVIRSGSPIADSLPLDVRAEIIRDGGLGLPQIARRFPPYRQGRPVNPSTVWRWITEGVRLPDGTRVRLEAARVGGRWLTSAPALARFMAAQTPRLGEPAPAPRTPGRRRRASEAAARELEKAGI